MRLVRETLKETLSLYFSGSRDRERERERLSLRTEKETPITQKHEKDKKKDANRQPRAIARTKQTIEVFCTACVAIPHSVK